MDVDNFSIITIFWPFFPHYFQIFTLFLIVILEKNCSNPEGPYLNTNKWAGVFTQNNKGKRMPEADGQTQWTDKRTVRLLYYAICNTGAIKLCINNKNLYKNNL